MGPALNCTSLGAKFQEDIRKIGYSVSICENTDIKEIYTKYGGPSKCVCIQSIIFKFVRLRSRVAGDGEI